MNHDSAPSPDPDSDPERHHGLIEILSEGFERIGVFTFDHRWLVLGLSLGLLIVSGYFASLARFDASFVTYFVPDDPVYKGYLQYRDDFGSEEIAYIVYEVPDRVLGPWDLEIMRRIEGLTEALEDEVPFVSEVTSLVNVEFMEGVPDGIEIYDLLEDFPETQEELLEARAKVLGKPMMVGGFLSEDARYAALILEFELSSIDPIEELRVDPEGGDALPNLYPQAPYLAIQEILARPEYEGIEFHHVGDIPINAIYNIMASEESVNLLIATLAVIIALLFLFFRNVVGVIGPVVVVLLSLMVAVGFMGILGWNMDLMFGMLPTIIIAVGVADAVHIISEFRSLRRELGDRREAARRTMYLVGPPCLFTSLTTAAGFASMSVAPIRSIANFAIYSAVGVMAAFFLSVTLLLVFMTFGKRHVPDKKREVMRAKGGARFKAFLRGVAGFDVRHRRVILTIAAVIFLVGGAGMTRLRVDSNMMTDFKKNEPIRVSTEFVDEVMSGSMSLVYLFDSGQTEGIKDPAVLKEIERFQIEAESKGYAVNKTYSIVDILKDLNQSFHEGDPAFHVLPEDRNLIAQYLLLYETSGGEEAQNYVSSDYSTANLELRCKLGDMSKMERLAEELGQYIEDEPFLATEIQQSGIGSLWLILMSYIVQSQIRGFLVAFSVIFVLLCLIFRSLKTGMIAMVPNLAPVVVTLGSMGWLDIPLDYVRLFIGTVAIGISVDDTIHHVTRCVLEFNRRRKYEEALEVALQDVGRALVITSVVLVLGFLVFMTSAMHTYVVFGMLLATTIVVALVADFILMPALILTFKPFGPEREGD